MIISVLGYVDTVPIDEFLTIFFFENSSLRKHPFLLALRRWVRFARNVPTAAKSVEKRMFSQARKFVLDVSVTQR